MINLTTLHVCDYNSFMSNFSKMVDLATRSQFGHQIGKMSV